MKKIISVKLQGDIDESTVNLFNLPKNVETKYFPAKLSIDKHKDFPDQITLIEKIIKEKRLVIKSDISTWGCFLEGDIAGLLKFWSAPPALEFRHQKASLSIDLVDGDMVLLDGIKKAITQNKLDVTLTTRYRAADFTDADYENYDLFFINDLCINGIGFTEVFADNTQVFEQKSLTLYNEYAEIPKGRLLFTTETALMLFKKPLIDKLKNLKLDTGLKLIPVAIETPNGKVTEGDWFVGYSDVNLGSAEYEERFIDAYNKSKWHNEHFCMTGLHLFLISKEVYKFFKTLPKGALCEDISYTPVDLI